MTKKGWKHDFTLIAILLIPVGVAINVVIGEIVQILKLPLFLNAIGTVIVGMVAGPWVGLVTGGVTNLVQGLFNPVSFAFAPVSMAIGFAAGLLSTVGMLKNFKRAIVAGVIITLVTIVVASPIQVLMFGGISGTGSDTFTAVLLASGQQIWTAVITQKLFVESADKIVSVMVAFWIVKKMSDRYLSKHHYGEQYMKDAS
ncbi:ECF transporter S component [Bacillus sp. B15-48]|uniref:ECF transporter S component n=1 Tax=Bacillus sp. B15-48 TaxID=1548601 RepID=UPI001EF23805|nr:ECF transporter S component [Bacillus sp. B15-48]MBM4761245.1 ECF transporter S component [Bacillus sp. B15-48]